MKINLNSLIFTLFILLFNSEIHSQTIGEFEQLKKSVKINESKKSYSEARDNENELQLTFSMLFLFYKSFISSQDNSKCNFTPSCSEYALQCIKKFGLIKGSLNALDRLSRCNGLAPEQYEVDEKQHLLIDKP